MNNKRKNIDRLFEEHLKAYKATTPIYAWDKLDQQLQNKKAGKSIIIIRWVAASVLILLAFGAGFWVATSINKNQDFAVDDKSPIIENFKNQSIQDDEPIIQNPDYVDITNTIEQESNNMNSRESLKNQISNSITDLAQNSNSKDQNLTGENSAIEHINKMHSKRFIPDLGQPERHYISQVNKITFIDFSDKYETTANDFISPEYLYANDFIDHPKKEETKSQWIVGAQIAPIMSYRDISTTYTNSGSTNEDNLNNIENNMLAMAGGLDIGYNLSDKWNIQSGVYFSRIGQINSDPLTYKHEDDQFVLTSISTSIGEIEIDRRNIPDEINQMPDTKDTTDVLNAYNVKVVQNFDLFEIPLIFRYKLLNKKFSINLAGGLSPAFVINNNTYLEADSKQYDIGNPNNLNPFIINSSIAMGFEYSLSGSFSVNFEPTIKYALSPINKNSNFNYHPYSVSWFTGLRYRF